MEIRKKNRKNGLQRILYCPHQSSNRPKAIVSISTPNRRISGHEAAVNAVEQINSPENKGTKDPEVVLPANFDTVLKHGSRLNTTSHNNYIADAIPFGEFMDQIVDIEGNPPELGGSREFHYWRFQSLYDHSTGDDLDKVVLQIFEQGYQDDGQGTFTSTPNVTLKRTTEDDFTGNTLEFDSNEEPELATNIILICDKTSGSWPKNAYAKFQGAKDAFRSSKPWIANENYLKGRLVRFNNLTYEAKTDHSSATSPSLDATNWIQRIFTKPADWQDSEVIAVHDIRKVGDIAYEALQSHTSDVGVNDPPNADFWTRINFVPTTDYSLLTKQRAQDWINAMAGYVDADTNNGKTAYVDHNCVIKDKNHRRTDVDGVYDDSADIPIHMKKDIGGIRYPIDTLRILVNGTGLGDFAGTDPNGRSFDNTVAIFRDPEGLGTTGTWYVLEHWGDVKNDDEIVDYEKGDSWTYKPCLTGLDINGNCTGIRDSGWTLGAYAIFGQAAIWQNGGKFDCLHPVKFDVSKGHVSVDNEKLSEDDADEDSAVFAEFEPDNNDSKKIAGLNFAFPWPRNENFVPHGIVTIGEKIALSLVDFLNKHKTSSGKKEWFGPEVEEYFDMQGFGFFQRIDEVLFGLIDRPTGNYKMQIWLVDDNDSKITIDYLQQKRGFAAPMTASLGKRKIQRSVPGISTFIRANEPEVLEIFDFEKVRRGGIETAESFDKDDRFITPLTNPNLLDAGRFGFSSSLKISVDAFRGLTPLVVSNVDEPTNKPERNIPSEFINAPEIFSYAQAKSAVKNLEPIFNFERDEFPIVKKFSNDVGWGDSIYYEDNEAIDETTDGKPNTIKAVVDNNHISISKGGDSAPGGFRQTLHLITRLWNE